MLSQEITVKKLLIVALTFSFCAADAGLWQKFKNKITGKKTQQVDEIGTWLSNVQGVVSSMISDVQEISKNVVNWEIQNAVTGLNTTLTACYADPFKIFANKSEIDAYIKILQGKGETKDTTENTKTATKTTATQTVEMSKLMADYQNLSSIITSYNATYVSNLTNMITPAKNIQSGWKNSSDVSVYADQLVNALEACKGDATKVTSYLASIKQYISQLSTKLGASHVYMNTLNNGVTYLQTHIDLQQRSAALGTSSGTTSTANYMNKLNTAINAVKTVQSLKGNTTNGTASTTAGITTTGTTSTSAGGVNYQNLVNTGMNLYNQYKNANGSAQTSN